MKYIITYVIIGLTCFLPLQAQSVGKASKMIRGKWRVDIHASQKASGCTERVAQYAETEKTAEHIPYVEIKKKGEIIFSGPDGEQIVSEWRLANRVSDEEAASRPYSYLKDLACPIYKLEVLIEDRDMWDGMSLYLISREQIAIWDTGCPFAYKQF